MDLDRVTTPELPVNPTEPQPVKVITPTKLITLKSGTHSIVTGKSPIVKKIHVIRPQDSPNSTIDLKSLLDHKNKLNAISSDKLTSKSFIIKNLPKDLKVTTTKNPSNLFVPQGNYKVHGHPVKLQLTKQIVLKKTLDKQSQEKLLAATQNTFINDGSIKLVTKPKTIQITNQFDAMIKDKNVKINFDKLEKITKEEFEAGTSMKDFKNKNTPTKLVSSIQIINGKSTTNPTAGFIKLIPSKTSETSIHIRNFDNRCTMPLTPPKMIVKNRFIDDLKTSPRLSSRSQSVDVSPGKIDKTTERRLSQPINFNNQDERRDEKLIEENKEEIESLLCSENLDNINEDGESISSKIDQFGYRTDVDFFNQVKWINGITYLNKSNLHFRYNELGLVDLIDEKKTHKTNLTNLELSELTVPLHIREGYERRSTASLICKVCSSAGNSHEFLTKSICSVDCMNLGEKQFEANKQQQPVKIGEPDKKPYLQNSFIWDSYLTATGGYTAPLNLFTNPFPASENLFEIGMKLEAIDPLNASKFCVCTVVGIQGYRIKLSFDGYSVEYDFWVNADSMEIFPPGWCDRTGRKLVPPPNCKGTFNWELYTQMTATIQAPVENFKHLQMVNKNPFKIGMKLEADDLKNSGRITVATVEDVLDNRILVSFDGYSKEFCYWTDISAPYIHPVNWHKQCGFSIISPPHIDNFSWNEYLNGSKTLIAPKENFICRSTIGFEAGMKLEVVDRKLPCLIRPATVLESMENGIKILYDGWSEIYNYWLPDDSPDLHPVNWCRKTNHALEYPANWQSFYKSPCKIDGCRGIGHAMRKHSTRHYTSTDCPYEYSNWIKEVIAPSRFQITASGIELPHEYRIFKKRKSTPTTAVKQKELNSYYSEPEMIELNPILTPNVELKKSPEPEAKKPKPNPPEEAPTAREIELAKRFNVSQRFLSEYGPRLIQSHELWTKNSKILRNSKNDVLDRNPLVWSVEEVAEYISYIPGCENSCKIFRENAIDGSAFLCLTKDDIENIMKVKVGPSIKIISEIIHLREEVVLRFKI